LFLIKKKSLRIVMLSFHEHFKYWPFYSEAIGSTALYAWGLFIINGLNGPLHLLSFSMIFGVLIQVE